MLSALVRVFALAILVFSATVFGATPRRTVSIPVVFEPNQGQTSSAARFLVRGSKYAAFFEPQGASFKLARSAGESGTLRFRWEDSAPASLTGEDSTGGVSNYLKGSSRSEWKTGIPHYSRLRYRGLYEGIDVVYYSKGGEVEYDLIVAPGADPRKAGFRVEGARSVKISGGELVIAAESGDLRHRRPIAYQETAGVRTPVDASYRIDADGVIRFEVGDYDHTRELIIDPTIAWGLYAGGSSVDQADEVAVDRFGASYMVGHTLSADFPALQGGQMQRNGPVDAFVFKMNPAGTTLIYSTFLGGSGFDAARGVTVDGGGSPYITGETNSSDFPAFAPLRNTLNGPADAFAAKLGVNGNTIVFSTYLGGSQGDYGTDISIDNGFNVYVSGRTNSPDFHNAVNSLSGPSDGFAARINANGQAIAFTAYVGGSGADNAYGIAAANNTFFYVAGDTSSKDLSGTAFQPSGSGSSDAFLAKLSSANGSRLFWAYLGGSGTEVAESVAIDGDGNAVVTGYTNSANFPLQSAIQGTYGGGTVDAFVSKVKADGSALLFSTFLGGSGEDRAYSVAIDPQEAILVAGETLSPNFPLKNSLKSTPPGASLDAFVTKLDHSGTTLLYSSLFGGSGADRALGIVADQTTGVLFTGLTTSPDLPVTINTSLRNQDAFLFKLAACSYTFAPNPLPTGSSTLYIYTSPECAWTVAATHPSQSVATVGSPSKGFGNGSVSITSGPGTIAVGSIPVEIRDYSYCTYSLTPVSTALPSPGGTGSVALSTQEGCGWNASASVSWISVSNPGGNGPANISYSVAPNSSASPRTGIILVGGNQTLTITQKGTAPAGSSSVATYSGGNWRIDSARSFSQNAGNTQFAWGSAGAKPVVADWDGDGRVSVAVFIQGDWYVDFNGNGGALGPEDLIFRWGGTNGTPVPGDWNGDGVTDAGVWENGVFQLDLNGNRRLDRGETFNWGPTDAIPVAGDWNGDGRTKIGVFKNGLWTIDVNGDTVFTAADRHFHFGSSGDTPVVGDWSGSGTSKAGISKDGVWILDANGSGAYEAGDPYFQWGNPGATPVVGDWNGSGTAKAGVFEAGQFTLDFNGDFVYTPATDKLFAFGTASSTPFAGRW